MKNRYLKKSLFGAVFFLINSQQLYAPVQKYKYDDFLNKLELVKADFDTHQEEQQRIESDFCYFVKNYPYFFIRKVDDVIAKIFEHKFYDLLFIIYLQADEYWRKDFKNKPGGYCANVETINELLDGLESQFQRHQSLSKERELGESYVYAILQPFLNNGAYDPCVFVHAPWVWKNFDDPYIIQTIKNILKFAPKSIKAHIETLTLGEACHLISKLGDAELIKQIISLCSKDIEASVKALAFIYGDNDFVGQFGKEDLIPLLDALNGDEGWNYPKFGLNLKNAVDQYCKDSPKEAFNSAIKRKNLKIAFFRGQQVENIDKDALEEMSSLRFEDVKDFLNFLEKFLMISNGEAAVNKAYVKKFVQALLSKAKEEDIEKYIEIYSDIILYDEGTSCFEKICNTLLNDKNYSIALETISKNWSKRAWELFIKKLDSYSDTQIEGNIPDKESIWNKLEKVFCKGDLKGRQELKKLRPVTKDLMQRVFSWHKFIVDRYKINVDNYIDYLTEINLDNGAKNGGTRFWENLKQGIAKLEQNDIKKLFDAAREKECVPVISYCLKFAPGICKVDTLSCKQKTEVMHFAIEISELGLNDVIETCLESLKSSHPSLEEFVQGCSTKQVSFLLSRVSGNKISLVKSCCSPSQKWLLFPGQSCTNVYSKVAGIFPRITFAMAGYYAGRFFARPVPTNLSNIFKAGVLTIGGLGLLSFDRILKHYNDDYQVGCEIVGKKWYGFSGICAGLLRNNQNVVKKLKKVGRNGSQKLLSLVENF